MKQKIYLLLFLSSLVTACGQIGSHVAAFPEPKLYRLQPGELVLAADAKDIPPIQAEENNFVQVEKADLEDTALVVGLFIGGESRAYPVRLLSLHEVVNDRIGEKAFAVTWCPLCYSPVVYDRIVDGRELSFRASGYLLHDNLVLVDHPTDTLWSQLLGQGIRGALRGSVLKVIPSTITTWEIWRGNYPDSKVLLAERVGYEGDLPDPYRGYFNSGAAGLGGTGEIDPRLPAKTLILGLVSGEDIKAYPVNLIREQRIIVDHVGDFALSIVWDEKQDVGRVFQGDIYEDLPENRMIDFDSLTPVPAQLVYWFAWTGFYPESELYRSR